MPPAIPLTDDSEVEVAVLLVAAGRDAEAYGQGPGGCTFLGGPDIALTLGGSVDSAG